MACETLACSSVEVFWERVAKTPKRDDVPPIITTVSGGQLVVDIFTMMFRLRRLRIIFRPDNAKGGKRRRTELSFGRAISELFSSTAAGLPDSCMAHAASDILATRPIERLSRFILPAAPAQVKATT